MTCKYQPGLRISEYLLEECIGTGAFCEVWRARHHVWSGDYVAAKLPIEPEYVRYLRREGVMVHGLRHPNIVRVLGIDPYADVPYLVMELVRGPSLRTVIAENPKGLALGTATTILRGVLEALGAAHKANVLHRDIKPGNVMLDLDGKALDQLTVDQVKVADFGLGAGGPDVMRSVAQSGSLDRDDRLVGTLAYMAPELRDGVAEPGPRSDLYSVGVVLFELLTGERPAGAELPSGLRGDLPLGLDEIYRKLYARLDRRYESAQAALADLDQLTSTKGARRVPPVPAVADVRTVRPPPFGASRCQACRAEVDSADQFCVRCGAQVQEMVRRCTSCGGYPGPSDKYCIFCGARLPALFATG